MCQWLGQNDEKALICVCVGSLVLVYLYIYIYKEFPIFHANIFNASTQLFCTHTHNVLLEDRTCSSILHVTVTSIHNDTSGLSWCIQSLICNKCKLCSYWCKIIWSNIKNGLILCFVGKCKCILGFL